MHRRGLLVSVLTLGLSAALPNALAQSSKKPAAKKKPTKAKANSTAPTLPALTAEQVKHYAAQFEAAHQLPASYTAPILTSARFLPKIIPYMELPKTGSRGNWAAYKVRFTDPLRIRLGKEYLAKHAALFAKAQAQFGVPKEIIAAIMGIETLFGRNTGSFRVLDGIATYAFHYPRREAFFQQELVSLLRLGYQNKLDALSVKGSFAGAMGLVQFMPSSLEKWAVDFDGDGVIDLLGSPADAIGSVANYLATQGWNKNRPVALEAAPPNAQAALNLAQPIPIPKLSLEALRQAGFDTRNLPEQSQWAVIDLQHTDGTDEFLLGTENFYAITHYNRSFFYAAAVWYLAQAYGLSQ